MIGCSGGSAPARTMSGGNCPITSPTVSGRFVGGLPAWLKGDKPVGALIGGASTDSLPAILNNGAPPNWKGEAGAAEGFRAEVACMAGAWFRGCWTACPAKPGPPDAGSVPTPSPIEGAEPCCCSVRKDKVIASSETAKPAKIANWCEKSKNYKKKGEIS